MIDVSDSEQKIYYLDHAATTPLAPEVLEKMMPFLQEQYGNASAVYPFGLQSKKAVDQARRQLASLIGASPSEIYFTSCGTEADNWVLNGIYAQAMKKAGNKLPHIITTQLEHHAILHTCQALEKFGVSVTYLKPDEFGRITAEQVENAIRPETMLVSVMSANNEIGTIEPLSEIGEVCDRYDVLFHTDAVQMFGHEDIDVNAMHIDYLSASAHKLNGPKGVGFLYMRHGKNLPPFLNGGAQENGRRAGTENVAGIVGFGEAARLASTRMGVQRGELKKLRDYIIKRLLTDLSDCMLNGDPSVRLANNISILIPGIEGETLTTRLGQKGICAGSGSACSSGAATPSHVLKAIGHSHRDSFSQLRLTIGPELTKEDADYVIEEIIDEVRRLRDRSY